MYLGALLFICLSKTFLNDTSHLTHVEAPKDGISPALMEAAKQDLIEKKGYAEMRKSAVGDAIAVGIAGLKKTVFFF